jgi:hypothetical protein
VEPFVEDNYTTSLPFREDLPNLEPAVVSSRENEEIQPPISIDPSINEFVIQTTNEGSINSLRQKVAEKLSEKVEPMVRWMRFTVFIQQPNTELSTYPSALRGALTGIANLNAEILIEKSGQFNKAQVEQLVEQLPAFAQAFYKAELKGVSKIEEDRNK